jgi:hypothetical protein
MTDKEVMKMALETLEEVQMTIATSNWLNKRVEALRTALAQPEPEPVAVWELQEGGWDTIADADWMETLPVGTKLYTTQPQREWVGLTDEDLVDCETEFDVAFAHDIEAKLKEKNT